MVTRMFWPSIMLSMIIGCFEPIREVIVSGQIGSYSHDLRFDGSVLSEFEGAIGCREDWLFAVVGEYAGFDRVGVDDVCGLADDHPRAALLAHSLSAVLHFHVPLAKLRNAVAEDLRILLEQLAEQLGLGLSDDAVIGVSIDECGFHGRVRVQIKLEHYLAVLEQLPEMLFYCVDCGAE